MQSRRSTKRLLIQKVRGPEATSHHDVLVVEEPLEIKLAFVDGDRRTEKSTSVTMRTPGHDFELAVGFLCCEGIVRGHKDIEEITYSARPDQQMDQCNIVSVHLHPEVHFDPKLLLRHFYTTSSCGVCGKASLEALRIRGCPVLPKGRPAVSDDTVRRLAEKLRQAQEVFEETGALHAAGLFDVSGNLTSLHEDVGRHNAVDKVIGEQLLADRLPLHDSLLMVSGRASFEIMQKAIMAGIPVVAAVSAPSSLAVDLADQFNMTLLGFVRGENFNIYAGAERIQCAWQSRPL